MTVAALAAVTMLAACSGSVDSPATDNVAGSASSSSSSSSSSATPTPAELDISPAKDATGVLPTEPVVVKATTGTLGEVTVVDAKGRKVAGDLGTDGTWTSSARLAPSAAYTVTAHGDGSGRHAVDDDLHLQAPSSPRSPPPTASSTPARPWASVCR